MVISRRMTFERTYYVNATSKDEADRLAHDLEDSADLVSGNWVENLVQTRSNEPVASASPPEGEG